MRRIPAADNSWRRSIQEFGQSVRADPWGYIATWAVFYASTISVLYEQMPRARPVVVFLGAIAILGELTPWRKYIGGGDKVCYVLLIYTVIHFIVTGRFHFVVTGEVE